MQIPEFDYINRLLAALTKDAKRGWRPIGIMWGGDPYVQYQNPKGEQKCFHFIPIEGGIRFTEPKTKDIIVNDTTTTK